MNKEKLITRIESEIKKSKNRLNANNQEKRMKAIEFEKGFINALSTIKFDIKYCNSLK